MSKATLEFPNGQTIEARIVEECVITYEAHATVSGRYFSTYDHDDEEDALDDLRAEILQAFPELGEGEPEMAEEVAAQTPLWMRAGRNALDVLERWNNGAPMPATSVKTAFG